MLTLVDSRIPKAALWELQKHSQVLPFSSSDRVYDAISGHPDIFFCQTPFGLVAAPNTPESFLEKLQELGVKLMIGKSALGSVYPQTAQYNALFSNDCLVHNTKITDASILELACGLEIITVKQGYTRCNLIEIEGLHITSDLSILQTLTSAGKEAFYVSPNKIQLTGVKHGFFGGCAGFYNGTLFIVGSLNIMPEGKGLARKLEEREVTIVELYNGPLIDVGGILVIG